MEKLFRELRKRGLEQVGIFRLSANRQTITELSEQCNAGIEIDLETADVHVCAGLLKLFFRDMSEPLMTTALYNEWIATQSKAGLSKVLRLAATKQLLHRLPPEHYYVLYKLAELMREFDAHSAVSNMNLSNLAIVFAPNLFRLPQVDMLRDVHDAPYLLSITKSMFENFSVLFSELIQEEWGLTGLSHLCPHVLAAQKESRGQDGGDKAEDKQKIWSEGHRQAFLAGQKAVFFSEMEDCFDYVETELCVPHNSNILAASCLAAPTPLPNDHLLLGNLFENPTFNPDIDWALAEQIDLAPSDADERLLEELTLISSPPSLHSHHRQYIHRR